ncbi:MAG: GNAT family N-acetyltransferase [Betaproteobacteria bacterium]|nr:GNAT family N-acetyltransferase [Betaproteobacteria bacterium]
MADENITLRLARLNEAPVIAAMSRDLIETGLGWSWDSERVSRAIRSRDTAVLVACDRMRVAAFAIMYFGDEHAHLNLLAVRTSHQRRGIGKRMVNWLIESALTAGIATVTLELRAANAGARRFYQTLGFTDAAQIPGYYRGRETALRMSRTLRRANIELPRWSMPSKG